MRSEEEIREQINLIKQAKFKSIMGEHGFKKALLFINIKEIIIYLLEWVLDNTDNKGE